jgi:hypothetical protein
MPAFVIDGPTGTVLCSPNSATGEPDKKSAVPVQASITSSQIQIVGEQRPRSIISSTGGNGRRTFLVDGSTAALRNKDRRRGLHKARSLLYDLERTMRQLTVAADTNDCEPIRQSLQTLFDWVHAEYDREQSA